MTTTENELRLVRLEISDFMRVRALSVDLDGNHLVLHGPNGSGKSSALDAIWAALGGKAPKDTPEPIHRGAERASVRLNLGEYSVERSWTNKGSKLSVTPADGSEVRKPQQLLDGLLGRYALDPVAFLDQRPQEQVADVLQLVGVVPPEDQVYELTGERHLPGKGELADQYLERLCADETGLYYVRRREAHRAEEQKAKALAEQATKLESLGGVLREGEQPAAASALVQRLADLQAQAEHLSDCRASAESARTQYIAARDKLAGLIPEQQDLERRLYELKDRIERGTEIVAALERDYTAAQEAVNRAADPMPEMMQFRTKLAAVEAVNESLSRRKHAQEILGQLANEKDRATREHQRIDAVLEGLRGLRLHLLDGLDLGHPELGIGGGELLLHAISFRQASRAERLRVACAIAMRQNPRLKLLRVDDGEHLDRESWEMLLRMAETNGWQVLSAKVADEGELRVEIVEATGG